MRKRRITSVLITLSMLAAAVSDGNIIVQVAGSKVSTKMYTVSEKPGTYKKPVNVTIKANKGFKVYYSTGKSLSVKKLIKSGKSKKINVKKTTTIKIYAVKKSVKITKKKLLSKQTVKKIKSYKYIIKPGSESSENTTVSTPGIITPSDSSMTQIPNNTPAGNTPLGSTPADGGVSPTPAGGIPASSIPSDDTVTPTPVPSVTDVPASSSPGVSSTPKASSSPGVSADPDITAEPGTTSKPGTTASPKPTPVHTGPTPTPEPPAPEKETFGSLTSGTLVSDMDIDEETFDVPEGEDTHLSADNSDGDYVNVTLPEGSFDEDTKISVRAVGGKVDIRQEGKDFTRLKQPATIQISLPDIPDERELDYYKAAYYFGDTTYFIDPDREQLKKGILEFSTSHFSWFGATKLSEAEMRERMARGKALDEVTLEYKQKALQGVIDDIAGKGLTTLGLVEGSKAYNAVTRTLGQSTEVYNLIQSSKEGDVNAAMQKLTEITINVLAENPDYLSATKVNITASVVGNSTTLFKAMKDGKYSEAATAVLKTYSDTIPAVKYGKAAVALWETGVDWIKDYDTEAAYQIFIKEIKDGEHGITLSNDGSGMDGWNRVISNMETTITQKVIELKKSGPKSYMDYTEQETAELRSKVITQLQNMFMNRYNKEKDIAAREQEIKYILNALDKENMLSTLFYGSYVNNDYEVLCERMLGIYKNIENMIGEENLKVLDGFRRDELAGMVNQFVNASWVEGKNGLGGREAVYQYMKEKYGVDIDEVNVELTANDIALNGAGEEALIELAGAGSSSTTWRSTNSSIATVDVSESNHNIALITAKNPGVCRITAVHNAKTYECYVTVRNVTNMKSISMHVGDSEYIKISEDQEKGDAPIKWSASGAGVDIESGKSFFGEYTATITAGSMPGEAQVMAVVDNARVYIWNVTIKDVAVDVSYWTKDNTKETCSFSNSSEDNVVNIYLNSDYGLNDFGITVRGLRNSDATETMSWEADEAFIGKKNPLTNETGFSGKLSYLGKTTMTLNIPYLGRKISFIINVDGELKITRKDNGIGRISWIFNVQNVDPRETVEWYIVQGSAYYEIFALGNGYDNGGEGENESGEPWNGCEIIRKSEWSEWNADPDRVNEPVVIQAVWGSKTGMYETDMDEM